MFELTVRQQIQRYLNEEVSRSDVYFWAYDNIPKRLDDAIALGDEDKSFGFLIGALAEYDFVIEYAGFSQEKAEAEFREALTGYLFRSLPRPTSYHNSATVSVSYALSTRQDTSRRRRSRKGLTIGRQPKINSKRLVNTIAKVA